MRLHTTFEWDEDKAKRNLKKHRVSFEDAARVLTDDEGDIYHIEEFDVEHSGDEERYITTSSHPDDRRIVLRVAWTDRSSDTDRITRIISARAASKREREAYAKEIGGA